MKNGKNCILVKSQTGKALGKAIKEIIFDEQRQKMIGGQGYQMANKYFRRENNVKMIMKIYEDIYMKNYISDEERRKGQGR